MNITLTFETLFGTMSRSLSIIGKRSVDEEGNLLFKDITIGTNEKLIAEDFMNVAANMLAAELSGFVTGNTGGVVVSFPSNHNSALDTFIQRTAQAYCVAYMLYSWFVITAPKIAEKYLTEADSQLKAIIRMVHEKNEPTASAQDYTNVNGQITHNT